MWQLLKAEIRYNTAGLLIGYGICMLFFTGNIVLYFGDFIGFMFSTGITFFISIGIMGSESDKEKRDRFQALLPVPQNLFSLSRLLFVVLFQLGIFALWLIVFFLEYATFDRWPFWMMISGNAMILIIISQFIINHDLGFFFTKKHRAAFLLILFGIILFLGRIISLFSPLSQVKNFLTNISGAVILNLIWPALFYLCHVIFMRRKSYLA